MSAQTASGPWWDGPTPIVRGSLVVLAPHPDDEVLGCGGLLRWAVRRGVPVRLLAVTDGEASHARSTRVSRRDLVAIRRAERGLALARLGVDAAVAVDRLGLPDGRVADHEDGLTDAVRAAIGPRDVIVAPRPDDGHPDHDATGRAARAVGDDLGAAVWSVAIWAKVRRPDTLGTVRRLHLDPASRAAKADSVAAYRSQVAALGPGPFDGPVVHPGEVAAMVAGPELVAVA